MGATRIGVLVTFLLGCATGPAVAQTVRGTLLDRGTQLPVRGAAVLLFSFQGAVEGRTSTDEAGSFAFQAPLAGVYWLRIEPLGYSVVETQPFILERSDSLTLALVTSPEVVTLEGITVKARSRFQNRNYAGFLDRKRWGFGRFLGPDEVARMRAIRASDLLENIVPGIWVEPILGGISFENRGRHCVPIILVDGARAAPDGNINGWVVGSDIRAVEVYPQPEFAPPQLTMAPFNQCGVIALWTAFGLGVR